MPLHAIGLVSRYNLDHPDEKPPEPVAPLEYERVLKYNPNHDPETGQFTSGGGGRRGGTEGPPTHGAFGQKLKRRRPGALDPKVREMSDKAMAQARAAGFIRPANFARQQAAERALGGYGAQTPLTQTGEYRFQPKPTGYGAQAPLTQTGEYRHGQTPAEILNVGGRTGGGVQFNPTTNPARATMEYNAIRDAARRRNDEYLRREHRKTTDYFRRYDR